MAIALSSSSISPAAMSRQSLSTRRPPSTFAPYFVTGRYADAVLVIEAADEETRSTAKREKVPIHRVVLAAQSLFFDKLFDAASSAQQFSDTSTTNLPEFNVILPHPSTTRHFRLVLEWIYFGQCTSLSLSVAVSVLQLSLFFSLGALEVHVGVFLRKVCAGNNSTRRIECEWANALEEAVRAEANITLIEDLIKAATRDLRPSCGDDSDSFIAYCFVRRLCDKCISLGEPISPENVERILSTIISELEVLQNDVANDRVPKQVAISALMLAVKKRDSFSCAGSATQSPRIGKLSKLTELTVEQTDGSDNEFSFTDAPISLISEVEIAGESTVRPSTIIQTAAPKRKPLSKDLFHEAAATNSNLPPSTAGLVVSIKPGVNTLDDNDDVFHDPIASFDLTPATTAEPNSTNSLTKINLDGATVRESPDNTIDTNQASAITANGSMIFENHVSAEDVSHDSEEGTSEGNKTAIFIGADVTLESVDSRNIDDIRGGGGDLSVGPKTTKSMTSTNGQTKQPLFPSQKGSSYSLKQQQQQFFLGGGKPGIQQASTKINADRAKQRQKTVPETGNLLDQVSERLQLLIASGEVEESDAEEEESFLSESEAMEYHDVSFADEDAMSVSVAASAILEETYNTSSSVRIPFSGPKNKKVFVAGRSVENEGRDRLRKTESRLNVVENNKKILKVTEFCYESLVFFFLSEILFTQSDQSNHSTSTNSTSLILNNNNDSFVDESFIEDPSFAADVLLSRLETRRLMKDDDSFAAHNFSSQQQLLESGSGLFGSEKDSFSYPQRNTVAALILPATIGTAAFEKMPAPPPPVPDRKAKYVPSETSGIRNFSANTTTAMAEQQQQVGSSGRYSWNSSPKSLEQFRVLPLTADTSMISNTSSNMTIKQDYSMSSSTMSGTMPSNRRQSRSVYQQQQTQQKQIQHPQQQAQKSQQPTNPNALSLFFEDNNSDNASIRDSFTVTNIKQASSLSQLLEQQQQVADILPGDILPTPRSKTSHNSQQQQYQQQQQKYYGDSSGIGIGGGRSMSTLWGAAAKNSKAGHSNGNNNKTPQIGGNGGSRKYGGRRDNDDGYNNDNYDDDDDDNDVGYGGGGGDVTRSIRESIDGRSSMFGSNNRVRGSAAGGVRGGVRARHSAANMIRSAGHEAGDVSADEVSWFSDSGDGRGGGGGGIRMGKGLSKLVNIGKSGVKGWGDFVGSIGRKY
ncbi:hypothetical protein HK100_003663 [Physocladia obscura]|uniref:BTB domain-containing protein n=1 Tax=Physocladia obscura TaxID=109957 RepID=A0AAD5XL49_9FUNG|nr:hypothetical protein HK100_003663 [Physocladia obscura]